MHDWVLNNKNPGKVECVWSPLLTDNDSLDQGYEALLFMVQDGLGRLPPAGGAGGGGAALVAQCILEMWGLAASEDHVQ